MGPTIPVPKSHGDFLQQVDELLEIMFFSFYISDIAIGCLAGDLS